MEEIEYILKGIKNERKLNRKQDERKLRGPIQDQAHPQDASHNSTGRQVVSYIDKAL